MSKSLSLNLIDNQDKQVIALKYKSRQIGVMNEHELEKWGMALLMKIHVITGWDVPANELLNILVDQFQKKLVESYPDVNPDEVEYAFRTYGIHIKDWGKKMNLSLINEVMTPYLKSRCELSANEERSATPPDQRIYTDEELDNLARQDLEIFYQQCRRGIIPRGIHQGLIDIMIKDEWIKKAEEAVDFFTGKLNRGVEHLYEQVTKSSDE